MFHKRSRSFGSHKAANGLQYAPLSDDDCHNTCTNNAGTSSTLRMWRRKHRRSSSADDVHQTSADIANAAAAQIKAEQEELLKLRRTDVQLGKLLGEGGFARVFSVTVKKTDPKRKLALKQLRPELLSDKDIFRKAASALVQESRIMAQLKGHPHILQLRGVSCDAKKPLPTKGGFDSFFLVTDALRETMTDRLKHWQDNPAPTPKVAEERWNYKLQYALQTAKALAYCHEQGIVFRDCKVDNLGFSDEHTVQLFDFGMARELPDFDDAQTCTMSLDEIHGQEELFKMTICGTQRHLAPEVYLRGWYNLKADTYSWAHTVVELVTGKKPHPYMSLAVHKVLVLEGGGRPNVDAFPAGLQSILNQAWAQDISERWTMGQVVAALETYIGSDCSQKNPAAAAAKPEVVVLQDQSRSSNLSAVHQQRQQEQQSPLHLLATASAA
jgi:serine/threonine protein kinase